KKAGQFPDPLVLDKPPDDAAYSGLSGLCRFMCIRAVRMRSANMDGFRSTLSLIVWQGIGER
ncbi:hypothetical protein D7C36_25220, partial [Salmonella enterica]|nr:hypothetical protein [Salmonella enterica]